MNVISVANQKGGVGKSTIAQILGNALRHKGNRVLFIDLDQQGNLTYGIGINEVTGATSYHLLKQQANAHDAIVTTKQGDIIPASDDLASIDIELYNEIGKEYRIKEALEPLKNEYDFIIIDTPPTLSTVVINALTASNQVIIPTQADMYSLQGLAQLQNTIATVKKYTNPDLIVAGILITRFNSRTIYSQEIADMIEHTAKVLDTKVFESRIREAIAVKEAQGLQVDLFEYAPKANVTDDINSFIKELGI